MAEYPYILDEPCPTCGGAVVLKRRRAKVPRFCSVECYNVTIQKHTKIITNRTCPNCQKSFRHHKNTYCSKKCSNVHRAKPGPIKTNTCLKCGTQYQLLKSLGNFKSKYCSRECFTQAKITKYDLDLSALSNPYTLGQIWSGALLKDLLEIRLYGTIETLESISHSLASSYKIKGTRSEVWNNYFTTSHRVVLYNRDLIDKLLDLGISEPAYREWPIIPNENDSEFFRGYLDSVKIITKESESWIWMISRSMAFEAADKFGGKAWYSEGHWWLVRSL